MSIQAPDGGPEVEATITIEGVELTFSQAMTVRVAINNFRIELNDPAFARDLGPVADSYRQRLLEVQGLISRCAR